MYNSGQLAEYSRRFRWVLAFAGGLAFFAAAFWLRRLPFSSEPQVYVYLEVVGSLLCVTFAANALVRFRGTRDRIALVLAFGFLLSALIEMGATFGLDDLLAAGPGAHMRVPLTWMVSRTLLGVLLIAVLLLEARLPDARESRQEVATAFVIVGVVAYLTSAAYLGAPAAPPIHPASAVARPWDLLPAGIFLIAAVRYHQRRRLVNSAFDRTLCWAIWVNVACHLAASQSEHLLDASFTLAHVLKVSSYALVLGGALVDNARLFDQVHHLAVTDPLTGLANYRSLVNALESEIRRSRRTGRPFAVVLLDLDGLKTVNDRYGHLVGSRALCRLARVLRGNSRSLDTPARYGGDEFALVLPEAGRPAAQAVAQRVCQRLTEDGESPVISVSAGAAVFPEDGDTLEKLLGAADRALYRMKGHGSGGLNIRRIAACL